jgi:hypothetical protein
LRLEGWRWIAIGLDFPYGYTHGLRRQTGETVALTAEENATADALLAERDALEQKYADPVEFPDEVYARLAEIEAALLAFENRSVVYDSAEIARADVFVSIGRIADRARLCAVRGRSAGRGTKWTFRRKYAMGLIWLRKRPSVPF